MLDEKKLKESQSRIKQYLNEGIIKTKQKAEFVDFFLNNAEKSLNSANALYDLSTDESMQKRTGYFNFDGFLFDGNYINQPYYNIYDKRTDIRNHCFYTDFYVAWFNKGS